MSYYQAQQKATAAAKLAKRASRDDDGVEYLGRAVAELAEAVAEMARALKNSE